MFCQNDGPKRLASVGFNTFLKEFRRMNPLQSEKIISNVIQIWLNMPRVEREIYIKQELETSKVMTYDEFLQREEKELVKLDFKSYSQSKINKILTCGLPSETQSVPYEESQRGKRYSLSDDVKFLTIRSQIREWLEKQERNQHLPKPVQFSPIRGQDRKFQQVLETYPNDFRHSEAVSKFQISIRKSQKQSLRKQQKRNQADPLSNELTEIYRPMVRKEGRRKSSTLIVTSNSLIDYINEIKRNMQNPSRKQI